MAGAPRSMDGVQDFAARTSLRPNIITVYQEFGDPYVASEVRRAYAYGALTIVRWEPYRARLADIADGRHDAYLKVYAAAVRSLGLPVALTFAHEMNGRWYPWGSHQNTGRAFVAAWRRIHGIFEAAGASNVIWTWTPNVISGAPGVRLARWYPGDTHVDWIGLDGYFTADGPWTYRSLFGPTMEEIQGFSKCPFLIVETGVERGSFRIAALRSLLRGVAKDSRMLGFVYFNQRGSRDWALDGDREAFATIATLSRRLKYGFKVT
jgi:mannan endo-1,4-beta-mannosidase